MMRTNIAFPQPGRLHLKGAKLLATPTSAQCYQFIETLFRIAEVESIEINSRKESAEISFGHQSSPSIFIKELNQVIATPQKLPPALDVDQVYVDGKGRVRLYRNGNVVTSWKTESDIPGRLRVSHPKLLRNKALCHELERELMTVHGVERFKIQPITSSVLIFFNTDVLNKAQLFQFLNTALLSIGQQKEADEAKYELLLCTLTAALSASAQFYAPSLFFPAAGLFVYCGIPTFISAWQVLTKERRLGVDVLDAIVIGMCLISGELFAGAVLTWCLSFGRKLLAKAREDSRRRLVNVFGKQPRTAYVLVDGVEVNVPLDKVREGDIVAIHTGEMIPVDGTVCDGNAIVDQHALTGESVPVEKQEGSRVYASTLLIGGRILVKVEKAGKETTSAKISAILNDTAIFRLSSQSRGEEYADRAVVPTLALSLLGFATVGLQGATAIVNCDFGTGIRMAAPIGLLSCLSVCASRGILIKDGSALEQMSSIDTILFDKTGTLTQERPAIHQIHKLGKLSEEVILTYAAAAEKRVSHPIAAAIVAQFELLGIALPTTDESSFKIGYGISVLVDGKKVLVGSSRYLVSEGFDIKEDVAEIAAAANAEGHSLVFVALDKKIVGAIELAPSLREGIPELFEALRARGVKEIVIISGDHQKPTENLAKKLKVDRFFAEVLPEDKARYVELLQAEGRKVCFIGDGINDSIALKKANVSISLRGATSVATDTAQVVFMEESLNRLIDFIDISHQLERNVKISWQLILLPNLLCIGGAFFLGFGVMASVLANNVAAIAALANGLIPLRQLNAHKKKTAVLTDDNARENNFASNKRSNLFDTPTLHGFSSVKSARRVAALSMLAGLSGMILPVFPGWILILSSLGIFSSLDPRLAPLDRLIRRKFPLASQDAMYFLSTFLADYQKKFGNKNQEDHTASTKSKTWRKGQDTDIVDVEVIEIK